MYSISFLSFFLGGSYGVFDVLYYHVCIICFHYLGSPYKRSISSLGTTCHASFLYVVVIVVLMYLVVTNKLIDWTRKIAKHENDILQAMNPPAEWRRYCWWWEILEVRNLCRRDKSLRSSRRRQYVELSRLMSWGRPSRSLSHCLSADFHWTHCNTIQLNIYSIDHRKQTRHS